jgi:hypothetical protein
MDLSGASAVVDTVIRVAARQTMRSATMGGVSSASYRFGDDMPRLDPGNAGNSYLVYKLLVNPENHPDEVDVAEEPDPWLGGITPPASPSLDELERLRSWFVRGEPMPLNAHLLPNETRAVVRWILLGAPVSSCAD